MHVIVQPLHKDCIGICTKMASYQKSSGKWRAQIRLRGVRRFESFTSKADAIAWATKVEAEILSGALTPESEHTVADAMREYNARVSGTKRSGIWEIMRVKHFIREFPELADKKLSEANSRDFGIWRDTRLCGDEKRGIKAVGTATVLREINLYSHIFTTARDEWKWVSESPLKGMRRPGIPQPRTRRISVAETKQIVDVLGYSEGVPIDNNRVKSAIVFLFALETAMRAGEITSLTWTHVHEAERYVYLPLTKNGSDRKVPLSPRALELLAIVKPMASDFGGVVFGLTFQQLEATFYKAKKAALLPDINFHDTRREALTRMAKIFNVMELAKISGHTDLRILQSVYYAPDVSDLADKFTSPA